MQRLIFPKYFLHLLKFLQSIFNFARYFIFYINCKLANWANIALSLFSFLRRLWRSSNFNLATSFIQKTRDNGNPDDVNRVVHIYLYAEVAFIILDICLYCFQNQYWSNRKLLSITRLDEEEFQCSLKSYNVRSKCTPLNHPIL